MNPDATLHADIDSLWNYREAAKSERRLSEARSRALAEGRNKAAVILATQIARALGLQRKFEEGHQLLATVLASALASGDVLARWHLEKGRLMNSEGNPEGAKDEFMRAMELAERAKSEFYWIDAMHMLGIVEQGEAGLEWNLKAIQAAESATDPRARGWLGSLLNNTAWSLHDLHRYDEALDLFQKAEQFRHEAGQEREERIAKWCVARCLRSMKRYQEALGLQTKLHKLAVEHNEPDGFTSEEIGECLVALGHLEEAKAWFHEAYKLLSSDPWLKEREPQRIERLKEMSGVTD